MRSSSFPQAAMKRISIARPSDGIALALRAGVPIFVDENVLVTAGQKTEELPPMTDLSSFLKK